MHTTLRCAVALGLLISTVQAQFPQPKYSLHTLYDKSNFFQAFDFFTEPDPTHGFVEYVDGPTANAESLAGYSGESVFLGTDSWTQSPSNGRRSVRLTSRESFNHGLFIADIQHMPGSTCGTWAAYWMFGPDWPTSGEMDILEGINSQSSNLMTLHTSPDCQIDNQGAAATTILDSVDCGAGGGFAGCTQRSGMTGDYGDGFNAQGGGVYATEWKSDSISIWFFPRGRIPQDLSGNGTKEAEGSSPDPSSWGPPMARFNGGRGCDLDAHFRNQSIVLNTGFCGDWAGKQWKKDAECSALAPTCEQYVTANPDAFTEAYWLINSIQVYRLSE
jgi:hypothetical protein